MSDKSGRGLLAEGPVVIVSILIAFGLDASWDGWRGRVDLGEDLANVREEVFANLETLELHLQMQRTAVGTVVELAELAVAAGPGETIEVPDTVLLSALVHVPTYDPSTGAVDALIARGGLSQIEDRSLQDILTGFRTAVLDLREDELEARRIAHEEVLPLLWEEREILPIWGRVNELFERGLEERQLPSSQVRITNAPGLAGRLALRRGWLLSSLREIEILKARLEQADRLLGAELGGS